MTNPANQQLAMQEALDNLDKLNQWRGGLSQPEKSTFEAGWDAAIVYMLEQVRLAQDEGE